MLSVPLLLVKDKLYRVLFLMYRVIDIGYVCTESSVSSTPKPLVKILCKIRVQFTLQVYFYKLYIVTLLRDELASNILLELIIKMLCIGWWQSNDTIAITWTLRKSADKNGKKVDRCSASQKLLC